MAYLVGWTALARGRFCAATPPPPNKAKSRYGYNKYSISSYDWFSPRSWNINENEIVMKFAKLFVRADKVL